MGAAGGRVCTRVVGSYGNNEYGPHISRYDRSVSPPDLFGVVCSAIKQGDLEQMAGWDTTFTSIKEDAGKCPNLVLTEAQLERIRTTISRESSCVSFATSGSPAEKRPCWDLLGATLAAGVTILAAWR